MRRTLALAALCAPALADGVIRGKITDATPGGVAILCADTGVPLHRETGDPFTAGDIEQTAHHLWTAKIGDDGAFDLGAASDGAYRVVALRWEHGPKERIDDNEQIENPDSVFNVQGQQVFLLGAANVTIDGADATLDLSPPGDSILHIDCGAGNDETLLIASPGPTIADPILGPAAWAGPFLKNWIAGNRMPSGETTLHNLPAGDIHLTILSWDNNPGFGAGSVAIRPHEEVWVEIPFVATWSDGVHSPPPRLEPLFQRLRNDAPLDQQQFNDLLTRLLGDNAAEAMNAPDPLSALAHLAKLQGRTIEDGPYKGTPALDLFAALGYARMHMMLERQGREPNPYKGLEVTRRRDRDE